ncbi:MAG: hypothetical protein AVDCRST_MAG75-1802, partial [uncultured Propionibacteriaceae bacterium]
GSSSSTRRRSTGRPAPMHGARLDDRPPGACVRARRCGLGRRPRGPAERL